MASLDFESEKNAFSSYYTDNNELLGEAQTYFVKCVKACLNDIPVSKIHGRVKTREESIKKFSRKYRPKLESESKPYTIKEHITDLIGLRVVCLYEDDVQKIENSLCEQFELVSKTDKISEIENTDGSFGYKGLHLDLRLNHLRKDLQECKKFAEIQFEVQIRTIAQDSWSELDHKIQYKKSIPTGLKRRINTLAALFELADREFCAIREATLQEIQNNDAVSEHELQSEADASREQPVQNRFQYSKLTAFSFLKIAKHFFPGFNFEAHKVDGFTQEILDMYPDISRGKFNFYMRENIGKVKSYQIYFEKLKPNDKLNPYTLIRHCLYLGDKIIFANILTN